MNTSVYSKIYETLTMKRLFALGTLFTCGLAIGSDSSWSGPYMGLFVADSRLKVQSTATAEPGALGAGIGAGAVSNAMVGSMTYSNSERTHEMRPGVYAGYLWSRGPVIYGLEADLQDGVESRSSGSNSTGVVGFANTQVYEYEQKIKLDSLTSLRGRLGYAQGKWLFYFTAGVAHAKVSTQLNSSPPLLGPVAPPPIFVSSTNTSSASKIGWVGGMGSEVAITRQLRMRLEYLHYDLGSTQVDSHSEILHNNGALFSSANGRGKNELTNSVVRIGLTYAF